MEKNYKQIYEHLGDTLSKEIFGCRILYTETGMVWISKIFSTFPEGVALLEKLNRKDTRKVIFSAGKYAKDFAKVSYFVKWECFIDNYKHGTECEGLPVISFEDYLENYQDADVFVASNWYHEEMVAQLHAHGIEENKIIDLTECFASAENRQYFDLPELLHEEDEVFVDCGCYDGQTSKNFISWCEDKYKHIYAFEAEANKIKQCEEALPKDKVTIYPCGVWKESGKLHFKGNLQEGSCISEEGDMAVPVESLDHVLGDEKVTFIKMDIEGSELQALQGSKKLIEENHPKLAICVYHRPEDIYEIPQLLLEYNSDYTFYLRHYSCRHCDTVLYAIDKKDR